MNQTKRFADTTFNVKLADNVCSKLCVIMKTTKPKTNEKKFRIDLFHKHRENARRIRKRLFVIMRKANRLYFDRMIAWFIADFIYARRCDFSIQSMNARTKQKILHIVFTDLSSFKFVQCWNSVVSYKRTKWWIIQSLKNARQLTTSSIMSWFHNWLPKWFWILKEILKSCILFNRIEKWWSCEKNSCKKIFNLHMISVKCKIHEWQKWLNSWLNWILKSNILTRSSINSKHKRLPRKNSRQLFLNSKIQHIWCET